MTQIPVVPKRDDTERHVVQHKRNVSATVVLSRLCACERAELAAVLPPTTVRCARSSDENYDQCAVHVHILIGFC